MTIKPGDLQVRLTRTGRVVQLIMPCVDEYAAIKLFDEMDLACSNGDTLVVTLGQLPDC